MSAFPQDGSYPAVHNLILSTCHTFRRKRREFKRQQIDWEEIMQEAHLAYCLAKKSYNAEKGAAFGTWVRKKVFGRLMDMAEREDRDRKITRINSFSKFSERDKPATWNTDDWLNGLSTDAANVATLALGPVRQLTASEQPEHQRGAIRRFLRDLGWSRSRIQSAIVEIRESLS